MDPLTILVWILSITLAVFLILGIIALVKVVLILRSVKRLTDKAEHIADVASKLSESLGEAGKRYSLIKIIVGLGKFFTKDHKEGGKDGKE